LTKRIDIDLSDDHHVALTFPEDSATPALLVEQARALVQTEEARFAAVQTKTTTLLAVAGVLSGIGGGILASLNGRAYSPFVLLLVALLGLIAAGALLWSGAVAIGALKKKPEPEPKSKQLTKVIRDRFPPLLDKDPQEAALAVLPMLAKQHGRVHKASEEVNEGFRQASRALAIAVGTGLMMSLLIVFGATSKPQEVQLVKNPKSQPPAIARATIRGQ
jgi:hypothetical protein